MNSTIYSQILTQEKDALVVYNFFLIAFVGLIAGSFLNMLIYRLPLGISLTNPKRSTCTTCNHTILWYENIPVLSYLFLKGKCSNCENKISIFYPIIELLTAVVTLLLYIKLGLNIKFYFMLFIFYILIVLSCIDLRYKAVPDYLLVLLVAVTITYLIVYKIETLSVFFIFAGGIFMIDLFVTYYIQNIKAKLLNDPSLETQKAIGEGDIPIIAVIGGLLGLEFGILAIFLSAIFAIIPSIINMISKKEIETPFIPYLSLAFFVTYMNEKSLQVLLEGLQFT